MNTLYLGALSQLRSNPEILQTLAWHRAQRLPLALFLDCIEAPQGALIHSIDSRQGRMQVMCEQECALPALAQGRYAAVGSTPGDERFMGSGQFQLDALNPYALHLALPLWLDLAAATDTAQSQPLHGLSLHIGHPDPHQNDQVCRVLELHSGSLLVEWNEAHNGAPPPIGGTTHPALVFLRQQWVQLGTLRVLASLRSTQGLCVELEWDPRHGPLQADHVPPPTAASRLPLPV